MYKFIHCHGRGTVSIKFIYNNGFIYSAISAVYTFDEGMKKTDKAIFKRCLEKLSVQADECLYVGDGGSCELELAKMVGMKAVQVVWYLKEGTN